MARYAIYFVPELNSPLQHFGEHVLGRSLWLAADSALSPAPSAWYPSKCDKDSWESWRKNPARYGFHATLLAPFHLKPGLTQQDLITKIEDFAGRYATFTAPLLEVSDKKGFICLTCVDNQHVFMVLHKKCLSLFHSVQAPVSQYDLERRYHPHLNPLQRSYLQHYGYPYVDRAFWFHMTLSQFIKDVSMRRSLCQQLTHLFAQTVPQPLSVKGLALVKEAERGDNFQLVKWFAFGK